MGRIPSPLLTIMIYSLSWRPLITTKDQEGNLMAGEKNLLPQLWRPRDRATFGIPFIMKSGMPKPSFPLILIKKLLVYVWILYKIIIRSNNCHQSLLFIMIKGKKDFRHT